MSRLRHKFADLVGSIVELASSSRNFPGFLSELERNAHPGSFVLELAIVNGIPRLDLIHNAVAHVFF